MFYINQIPLTLNGAEMLKKQLDTNINIEHIADAFSMTGMNTAEVIKLLNTIQNLKPSLLEAYLDICQYSQHFLDQFTTSNNSYYSYAQKCMKEMSRALWGYKKTFFSFLLPEDWKRIKRNIRKKRRDLYGSSMIAKNAPVCKDLFPELFPPIVWNLLGEIQTFFSLFYQCVDEIEKTLKALTRREKDVKTLVKLYIQYRDQTLAMTSLVSENAPTPTWSYTNPLFEQSRYLQTTEERAQAWYHKCQPEQLDELLIYEHYSGSNAKVQVPIPYIVDNIYNLFGNQADLTYLIADSYLLYGSNMSLTQYCKEFKLSYEKKYNCKCVGYAGVSKAKNHERETHKYTNEFVQLEKQFKKEYPLYTDTSNSAIISMPSQYSISTYHQ